MDAAWIADVLGKVTALFVLGVGGAALLRRAPAATRYALWAGVLAGAALLPGLGRWLPHVHVAVPGAAARTSAPASLTADPVPAAAADALLPGAAAPRSPDPAPSPAAPLTAVWLAGVAFALGRLALGVARARRLAAEADEASPAWQRLAGELRRGLPGLGPVRLCASDAIRAPATFGVLRPVVLLPAEAERWPLARRRVVLMHELVHVARRDWAVQIGGQLVRAVYWFHPLAHVAAHRLAAERERACDERVVALGAAPSDYASHLLAIALALPRRSALTAAVAMARRSQRAQLEGRLMSILEGKPTTRAGRSLGRILVPALVLSVPALAAVRPGPDSLAAHGAPHEHACCRADAGQGVDSARPRAAAAAEEAARAKAAAGKLRLAGLQKRLLEAERQLEAQQSHVHQLRAQLEELHSALAHGLHDPSSGGASHPDAHGRSERERAAALEAEARHRAAIERELAAEHERFAADRHAAERDLRDAARELRHRHEREREVLERLHEVEALKRKVDAGRSHDTAVEQLQEALRQTREAAPATDAQRAKERAERAYAEALRARERALQAEHARKVEQELRAERARRDAADARAQRDDARDAEAEAAIEEALRELDARASQRSSRDAADVRVASGAR